MEGLTIYLLGILFFMICIGIIAEIDNRRSSKKSSR
jgi:hypothetical protein